MQGIRATVVGNLTADPEVRAVGKTNVANFDIAVNDGYRDPESKNWVDKGTTYVRAAAWGSLAEHIGQTVKKGHEVVLTGTLVVENYKTKEGQERSALVLTVMEAGVSLRWATADVTRVKKSEPAPFVTPDGWAPPADESAPPVTPEHAGAGTPF